MRTKLATILIPWLASGSLMAQDPTPATSEGSVSVGLEQTEVDGDSSKFNEYRDLDDGLLLDQLWYDYFDPAKGRFFELDANRIDREDGSLRLRAGRFGGWGVDVDWNRTPHLLSRKAMTPYFYRGDGLYDVPSTVPITFERLNTTAADAPAVRASDQLIASYLAANLHGTELGTQRDRGAMRLAFAGWDPVAIGLTVSDERKSGSKVTYGPIGDRPPRTLNIEFPEPIDYRTRDARLDLEHAGDRFQLGFSYLISDFENEVDTLTWENIFATPFPGAAYDVWDRALSAYGRRPLAPDNQMHQATASLGFTDSFGGRLSAVVAFGRLEQDESLLPYSFAEGVLTQPNLPQATANAEMSTTFANLVYSAAPLGALQLKFHARYYALDNDTPESDWWYVTSDTPNLNGTRSFKNYRTNLAYAYDTLNLGAEAQWRMKPLRSTLTATFEREEIARDYREADTDENRLLLQWRARPSERFSLKARYLYGDRDGDGYEGTVTRQSYWYTPAQAGTDNDNPGYTFSNHPDMRRYDVSDRVRNLFDLGATWTPNPEFSLNATFSFRDDDFDSDVSPTQPLAGLPLADAALFTPGDQLGLLEDERQVASLDAAWSPSERLTFTAFATFESAESLQRSLEFNENNKGNPSAVATASLGPWTRASSQWTATTADDNQTVGMGLDWVALPDQVTVRFDGSWSRGETDITYSGFGTTNFNGTPFPDNHEFAFRTPSTIVSDLTTLSTEVELRILPRCDLILAYGFESYDVEDWAQETETPWYESVGSEFLLRDSSRSHQWGNRLVNLGSYLAPGYDGHFGQIRLAIHF